MLRRFVSTGFLIIVSTTVLIALIGIVTYVAWRVINQTVEEQVQAAELQLITSLSQQTQASLSNLEGGITGLSAQEDIRAISPVAQDNALELIAEQISEYPAGTVVSVTRFDFRGEPQYAYPEALNEKIKAMDADDGYDYAVPDSLLELTRRGQNVSSDIEVELHRVTNSQNQQTVLLIAPVNAVNLRTGFLVFELDFEKFFASLYSFVQLGDSGQLWVLDALGDIRYQARTAPLFNTTYQAFSAGELRGRSRQAPFIDIYESDEGSTLENRQAAVASVRALNQTFTIFISRLQSETQRGLTQNVIGIFSISVVAMLVVVGLGSLVGRQIRQANAARQEEQHRRETARLLLDVSRALNSSLDLSTVLNRILEELQQLVPHDTASVLLLEEQEVRVAANRGTEDGIEVGQILRLDQARAAREVINSGYPLVINDTRLDERWTKTVEGAEIRSWIGLPLRVRDRFVGVLNVNSYDPLRFDPDDIELAAGFADQASVAIQNAQLHELEVKQFEQELTIARNIQTSLLPQSAPEIPMLEFSSHSLGANQVSGDFYQYLPMPDGKIGIAIGDVQGKGIPAALMMAVITTAIRDEVIRHQKPSDVLESLNRRLLERMKQNHMNSALIMATYDPPTRTIEIANGGMVQPYLRLPDTTKFEFVQVGGYPLGVTDTIRYSTKSLQFDPGAILVMFSDGVVEAQSASGEFFGFDRIENLLDALPTDIQAEEIKERILTAVKTHLGDRAPQDDTTIIVLRGLEQTVEATAPLADTQPIEVAAKLPVTPQVLHLAVEEHVVPVTLSVHIEIPECINVELYLPSKLGYEKVARGTIAALADEMGFPQDKIEDLKTAVSEACMNAIEHGNKEDMSQSVRVLMSIAPQWIEVRVTDRGYRNLAKQLPEPGKGDMRGWGLFFIQHLMDVFEINYLPDGGNEVRLVVYLPPAEAQAPIASAPNLADNGTKPNTNGKNGENDIQSVLTVVTPDTTG